MTWRHWVALVWALVVLILALWALATSSRRPTPGEPTTRFGRA